MRQLRSERSSRVPLIQILSFLLVSHLLTGTRLFSADDPLEGTINKLIADLRSDRFPVREAATHELMERVEAIPALRKAQRSGDLETRLRVQGIHPVVERKLAVRCLRKTKALGRTGRVVELADRLGFAGKCGAPGEKGWENLMSVTERVSDNTKHFFSGKLGHNDSFPAGDYRVYLDCIHPKEICGERIDIDFGELVPKNSKDLAGRRFFKETRGRLLLRGEQVALKSREVEYGLHNGMIAACGDVEVASAFFSVIVAGGNLKAGSLDSCIVICDGDVELSALPDKHNLIIARGKVTCAAGKARCMIRSGRTLQVFDGILFDGSRVAEKIDLSKDESADPVAFVKFFELADVGLATDDFPQQKKGTVEGPCIKDVRKDSPFVSGLRKGDMVTAVEDKKTPTTEIFRRVLRRKIAEGGPVISFTVRRAGKTLEVPIPVKD